MSQNVINHSEEVQALKTCIARLRETGGRRPFPEPVKARVLALRQAGWSVKQLASELGLAGSQIYSWAKMPQDAVARVMNVEPSTSTSTPEVSVVPAPGSLQLRLGAFCVTIAMAEGV